MKLLLPKQGDTFFSFLNLQCKADESMARVPKKASGTWHAAFPADPFFFLFL